MKISLIFFFLLVSSNAREQFLNETGLTIKDHSRSRESINKFPLDSESLSEPAKPRKHLSCHSQGYIWKRIIDENLLNSASSWHNISEFPVNAKPIQVLSIEKLYSKSSKKHNSNRIPHSRVKLVKNAYYKLFDFCLRPIDFGGLSFFGDEKFSPELEVCNELECMHWPYTIITKDPPSNAIWIKSASAVIPLFTARNPWHTLHFLIILTRLLYSSKSQLKKRKIHLFPGHVIPRNRSHLLKHAKLFSNSSYSLWPLIQATAPPGVTLFQVNLIEGPFQRDRKGMIPTLCYSSGLFGNTRVETNVLKPSPRILFSDISLGIVKLFQKNAISLANAEDINSGWCPYSNDNIKKSTVNDFSEKHDSMEGKGGSIKEKDDLMEGRDSLIEEKDDLMEGKDGLIKEKNDLKEGKDDSEDRAERTLPKVAFIMRKKRVICNIEALLTETKLAGFHVELLILEKMNIFEQIRAVRQVDVLIGMHGAGLTHVFWMHKGSVLIEIYPPNGPSGVRSGLDLNPVSNYGFWASSAGVSHLVWKDPIAHFDALWRNNDVVMNVSEFRNMLNISIDLLNKNKKC